MTVPGDGRKPRHLLPCFEYRRLDVDGTTINCGVGGSGPPVLLLHGYPENHFDVAHLTVAFDLPHVARCAARRAFPH
jgi:hypothetical protein